MKKFSKLKSVFSKPYNFLLNANQNIESFYWDKVEKIDMKTRKFPLVNTTAEIASNLIGGTIQGALAGGALGVTAGCVAGAVGFAPIATAVGCCAVGGLVIGSLIHPANVAIEEIEDSLDR